MGKLIFGVVAAACLLTTAGCGFGPAPADLCTNLTNCIGAENVPADFAETCPLAVTALQFALPDCYQCLSEQLCDAPEACEDQCASLLTAIPGL